MRTGLQIFDGNNLSFHVPEIADISDWTVAVGASFCALAMTLLALLVISHRRQRREIEALSARTAALQAAMDERQSELPSHELSGRLLKAQEQERSRLARDLHDDVTQRLARLAIDVGLIARGTPGVPITPMLKEVQHGLSRLSEDVHALAYRLHPSVLEDLGLADAIRTECEHFSRLQSTPVEIHVRNLPEKLPLETSLCLFRIAQESLRNVARHSKASAVQVSLAKVDARLQLAVRDDGIGFDTSAYRNHPSLGHASMRERARLLDGELDIQSALGSGTTVMAWVPFNRESP